MVCSPRLPSATVLLVYLLISLLCSSDLLAALTDVMRPCFCGFVSESITPAFDLEPHLLKLIKNRRMSYVVSCKTGANDFLDSHVGVHPTLS